MPNINLIRRVILQPPPPAAGGGGSFSSPLDLTGLIGWWDTSVTGSLSLSGGFCSAIADQSGNGNTANQATTTTTYSATGFNSAFPALIFEVATRAGYFTCSSFPMGTGPTLTTWYVGKFTDIGSTFAANGRSMAYAKPASNDYDNAGSWALTRAGSNAATQFARNSTGSNAPATLTSPHRIIETVDASGVSTTYVNGVPTSGVTIPVGGSVSGNWVSGGTMFLGSNGVGPQQGYWNGPLSEWGVATGFTNSTDVAALDLYLKTKWGM
jgi:hypothetical protein